MPESNAITTKEYWHGVWDSPPKPRLPSSLNVGTRDLKNLLSRYVRPNTEVLEVGCAPGKLLAWVAKKLKANVSGVDFSDRGIEYTRALFSALNLTGDLRCEDAFNTSFSPGKFDFVYSVGLIEHFDDPSELVRKHIELLKPGGTAAILVPNYRGLYGRLQKFFDPANVAIHNLAIMSPDDLMLLRPSEIVSSARAYAWGRVTPWLVSWSAKWPKLLYIPWCLFLNVIGLVQPMDLKPFSPWLVLELRRKQNDLELR